MRHYPIIVKYTCGRVYFDEDDYGRPVQQWEYRSTQFDIITCDEEFGDAQERCATSEGEDSMTVLGHIDYADMPSLGVLLLKTANKEAGQSGVRCHKCGSDDIEGEVTDGDGNELWESVHCNRCGFEGIDYYCLYDQEPEQPSDDD